MKYEIGDKVKLRSDLVVDAEYDEISFLKSMKKFVGKVLTIEYVEDDNTYQFKEDSRKYYFSEEMIEGKVEDVGKKTYKGWEILRMVVDEEIEEGCKIKDVKNDKVYEFLENRFCSTENIGYYGILSNDYNDFCLANAEFEIIEEEEEIEEPKEINIEDIEELDKSFTLDGIDLELVDKVNQIIKYLKQVKGNEI